MKYKLVSALKSIWRLSRQMGKDKEPSSLFDHWFLSTHYVPGMLGYEDNRN